MTSLSRHIAAGIAAAAVVMNAAPLGAEQDTRVSVTVKYTGAGTVDDTHRIWVWLFDNPNIAEGSIPIDEKSTSKNGDTLTFISSAKQVYVAIAYDEKGGFFGQAPPPPGSPVAMYGVDAKNATPLPVTPGPAGAISVTFDDSQRMP